MTENTVYTCTLTAEGWQMYSYEGYEHRARSNRRGKSLSKRLTKLVALAKEKLRENRLLSERKLAEDVRDKMYRLMNQYADDGAMDTEPQCVLVSELERAFGLDSYSLER